MDSAQLHAPMPQAAPSAGSARGSTWAPLALVGIALLLWLASMAVFLVFPLETLPRYFARRYLVLDATSLLFIVVVNTVFLGISVYLFSRRRTSARLARDFLPRAALSLLFMLVTNLAVLSSHLIVLWTLLEVSTLCATPLVARGDAALPRTVAWRYLLYSAMSLSLTFMGFMCLTQSASLRGVDIDFAIDALGGALSPTGDGWQHLGLAFMVFGLGGKLGLAPLYGWLPETYETAPTSTSALLAAVQFNISMVAVFRILQVCRGVDLSFVAQELLVMGYLSLAVAAVKVMAVRNYKRLIAYACISSSGVIALGLSVGQTAAYGVVLYVVSNAFVKALLFLTAGRLRATYGTNDVAALSGVIRILPFSGSLFTVGIFALLGFPPFAGFLAEMLTLSGIVQAGNLMAFTLMCVMLTVIFVATGRTVFPMLWGAPEREVPTAHEPRLTTMPKLGFVAILIMLGTYTPEPFTRLLRAVAQSIGG
ncbi:complex I subunit 5 family protein [Extensimonas sp. H3M7-6]|uniref:complex I subunit 5 family protein n=1 Tax=Extensimonas soli TaxID=3031322 RepID=UPI0023DCE3E9|nr:proton-conducting transporter membrane subunit [Extensimonas sp. H3M7-6]MDF1480699.1 proton-conducting transporter membrane subunit [Extensimonas sp. H3M7-6]